MKKIFVLLSLLFCLPICYAQIFSDDFNRADNITVGNGWSESLHSEGFMISGNRLNLTRNGGDTYISHAITGNTSLINVTFTHFAEDQTTNRVFNFQTGIYNQASRGCGIWFPNAYGNDQLWYHTDNFVDIGALCDDCVFANNTYVISLIYNMSSLTVGAYIDGVYQGNFDISGTCENADMIGFGTEDFNGQWFVDDVIIKTETVCTENWIAQYANTSCNGTFINEIKTYIDNNTCGTTLSLPLDNGTIGNTYFCGCVENWTENHVNVTGCINNTQQVMDVYIDLNMCNTTINLPIENGTIENLSCNVSCVEDWDAYFVNQSCLINDSMLEQKLYFDIGFCNTTTNLPVDNGSISNVYSCNYCSENIGVHYTAYGTCVLPQKLQDRTGYYIDSSYASCCLVTNISMDCHINNGSYTNFTSQTVCSERYNNRDLVVILGDGMGATGAAFVSNLDLIISLLAVLGIATIALVAANKFKT